VLQNLAPEPTQPDPNEINEIDMTREFIARKLTRKLLRLVGTIQAKQRDTSVDEELNTQFQLPVLSRSYLNMTNVLLEFVKFICTVLGLASGLPG
jgi:DNA polymerase epsilon subunit 1